VRATTEGKRMKRMKQMLRIWSGAGSDWGREGEVEVELPFFASEVM